MVQASCSQEELSLPVDEGQHDVGGPDFVVQNGVDGDLPRRFPMDGSTRIEIAIKTWETAAGDGNTEPVSGHEDIARRPQVDLKTVDLIWLE